MKITVWTGMCCDIKSLKLIVWANWIRPSLYVHIVVLDNFNS
jgi:hypothetical protein